jgi:tRNA A-37 threonylcarbamoyl transferase component Bud32
MTFIDSIFDDDKSKKYSLWKKDFSGSTFDDDKTIIVGYMAKKTTAGEFGKKYFCLTETHLFYRTQATDEKIRGYTPLRWLRAEFEPDISDIDEFAIDKDDHPLYCIRLLRNKKFTELFTDDKHFL